jgi:hypothetical protein
VVCFGLFCFKSTLLEGLTRPMQDKTPVRWAKKTRPDKGRGAYVYLRVHIQARARSTRAHPVGAGGASSHPSDSGAHRPRRYRLSGSDSTMVILALETTFSTPQEAGRYAALIAARLTTGKSS